MFGNGEDVWTVTEVQLKGPAGENLHLGRKLVTWSFLLPMTISDGGFVLKIAGDRTRYYPMPEGRELEQAQRRGLLPDPLPDWELTPFQRVYGHSLWVALLLIFGWPLAKRLLRNHA
ncbi:MAG: hypothetical protein ACREUX_24655 [Burkholderiales bacterium]